jgi:UrcA family protein
MLQLTPRIAGLATFAVIAAIGAAAHARPSIKVSDLDLATDAGKAAFAHRINAAVSEACGPDRNFSIHTACEAAVRGEVGEKLAAITPSTQFAALSATHSQSAIAISDLNMASAAGKATFAHRVDAAASRLCSAERTFSIQYACMAAVRAEATEKLAAITPATQFAAR